MLDLDGDGRITDSRELFGGTTSGFAALAALDGNHDGVVDAADDGLADFDGDGELVIRLPWTSSVRTRERARSPVRGVRTVGRLRGPGRHPVGHNRT